MNTDIIIKEWLDLSDDAMRLRCGEMTAQEILTVRAVLMAIQRQADKQNQQRLCVLPPTPAMYVNPPCCPDCGNVKKGFWAS